MQLLEELIYFQKIRVPSKYKEIQYELSGHINVLTSFGCLPNYFLMHFTSHQNLLTHLLRPYIYIYICMYLYIVYFTILQFRSYNFLWVHLKENKLEASKNLLEKLKKGHIVNTKLIFRTKVTAGIRVQKINVVN